MLEFIKQHPGIRLLLPFIIGILLTEHLAIIPNLIWITIAITGFIALMLMHVKAKNKPIIGFGVILILFIGLLGVFIGQKKTLPNSAFQDSPYLMKVRTLNIPKPTKNGYSCELQVLSIKNNELWEESDFNTVGYFSNDSMANNLVAGDMLLIKSTIATSMSPKNPFGFDYEGYLKTKNYVGSIFIKSDNWIKINQNQSNIKLWALNLRAKLVNQFSKTGIDGQNLAVVSALSLGYKDTLDSSLAASYSASGTIHLLAVSGMHVAIIAMVMSSLLSFLDRNRRTSILKQVIMLVAIWFYAFLTGLSPSVIRATVMFSFIITGTLLDKKASIYNSIAFSAFFILLFKPYYLYDIGFQLSYLAVIGIVYFYPIIEKWVQIPTKIGHSIWQLMAVSLAAQLITTPLILLYFKQFPVYFLISNVIVVFIGTLVLYGSLLLLIISPIAIIANLLGKVLDIMASLLNYIVITISHWPNAVIQNISITNLQCIMLYVVLVAVTAYIIKKKYIPIVITICALIVIQLTVIQNNYNLLNREVFCVYHSNKGPALQFISGKNCISISSYDTALIDTKLYSDALNYWQIKPKNNILLSDTSTFASSDFYFKNGIWLTPRHNGILLSQSQLMVETDRKLNVDYLVLTRTAPHNLSESLKNITAKQTIITPTVSEFLIENHEISLQEMNSQIYYIKKQGAFISPIE